MIRYTIVNRIMAYLPIAVIASVLMFCTGCEQTVDNVILPYEEKIVIAGYIIAGTRTVSVDITKTLPVQQVYTRKDALLQDAIVTLTTPSGQQQLLYNPNTGTYEATLPATIQAGESYRLNVEWRGKKATATTRIPTIPTILSTSVQKVRGRYYYDAYYETTVQCINDPRICVGGVNTLVTNNLNDTLMMRSTDYIARRFYYTETAYSSSADVLVVKNKELYYYYDPSSSYDYVIKTLVAFDAPFHALNLRNSNPGDDGLFGSTGTNPQFTVKGDGIGFFIGVHVFPSVTIIPTSS